MKTMKKTLSLFVLCALLFCNLSFSGTVLAFSSVMSAESGQEEVEWVSDCSNAAGGIFSYYVEEDTPSTIGSTFTMRFYVRDTSQIQSMTYSAIGFTVNGEPTVEADAVEFSVTHQADVNEPKLEIFYTLTDETEEFAGAYGICYEQGLFLSYASHDAAMSTKYLGYMKSIGAFTQEECQQFFNEYYNQKDAERVANGDLVIGEMESIQSPEASVMASSTQRTISGTIQWTDDNGNVHPCQYTRIDIYWYATLAPHERLGTVYTTANGTFSFVTDKSIWGTVGAFYPTFYVKVYAGGSSTTVKTVAGVEYLEDSGALSDSGNHLLSHNYTFTCGNDLGRAMQIAQATNIAGRYANEMRRDTDATINHVTVIYPSTPTDERPGACYSNSTIYIPHLTATNVNGVNTYAAWDTLMHEYGHHVQAVMGITDNPGTKHYSGYNMIDQYYNDAVNAENDDTYESKYDIPKTDAKKEGIRLAWAEGWATLFSVVAQTYYINILGNIATVGDTKHTTYQGDLADLEKNHVSSINCMGEGNEEGVAAALYDMYDSDAVISGAPLNDEEDFDVIYFTHQQMWDYVIESQAVTFFDFVNHLYIENYASAIELGVILEKAGFSANDLKVANNGGTLSSLTRPRFEWNGGGGSTSFPNNRFSLVLYNGSGNVVFQKTQLTVWNCRLTETEWNSALSLGDGQFYGVIIAEQIGTPQTGYSTGKVSFSFPCENISKGQTYTGNIPASECVWLRLQIRSDMRVSFSFSGSVNYEADMYYSMYYGNTEPYEPLEYNTTSPSLSFRYTRPCTAGEVFYIRLYTANGEAGTYSIRVY